MMLASLDPLGLPLAVDIEAGNMADDPLYLPSYRRVKQIITANGLLIVGDSKMSAIGIRAEIAVGQDYYLTPLAWLKDEPALLDDLLEQWQAGEQREATFFYPRICRQMGVRHAALACWRWVIIKPNKPWPKKGRMLNSPVSMPVTPTGARLGRPLSGCCKPLNRSTCSCFPQKCRVLAKPLALSPPCRRCKNAFWRFLACQHCLYTALQVG